MPDIGMCYGVGCPAKDRCYRCIAPPDPFWQAYADYDRERGENGICRYLWDVSLDDDEADNGFNPIEETGGQE